MVYVAFPSVVNAQVYTESEVEAKELSLPVTVDPSFLTVTSFTSKSEVASLEVNVTVDELTLVVYPEFTQSAVIAILGFVLFTLKVTPLVGVVVTTFPAKSVAVCSSTVPVPVPDGIV